MMTEWDDFVAKTCPCCHAVIHVPVWPASGEYSCDACGKYRGYAYPNMRRNPLVSGLAQIIFPD